MKYFCFYMDFYWYLGYSKTAAIPSGGKEVKIMEFLMSFMISVLASVVSYYICKWLDRDK